MVALVFIIQNIFAKIEIEYSILDRQPTSIRVFPRLSSDIFQKIWNNNGGVVVQKCMINQQKITDEKAKKDSKTEKGGNEQYFFIDSRNRIQIMFPNYE